MRAARRRRLACLLLALTRANPSVAQEAREEASTRSASEREPAASRSPSEREPAASRSASERERAGSSEGKLRAREAFEAGKRNLENQDLSEAVQNFELAYRYYPHYSVLFNLGQALALLNRPVEAKDALERYLREGGSRIPANRRARVEQLLERQRQHIGFVLVQSLQPGIELFVDGDLVGKTPLGMPLELVIGSHTLVGKAPGFEPYVEMLQVQPLTTLTVTVAPTPERPPASGAPSASTGGEARVGPTVVSAESNSAKAVAPVWLAAPSKPPGRRAKTTWLWATGASSVLLEATAVSLYLWNGHRYDQWRQDRSELDRKLSMQRDDVTTRNQRNALYDQSASIQRVDDLALAAALLGAAALATGVVQWLTD